MPVFGPYKCVKCIPFSFLFGWACLCFGRQFYSMEKKKSLTLSHKHTHLDWHKKEFFEVTHTHSPLKTLAAIKASHPYSHPVLQAKAYNTLTKELNYTHRHGNGFKLRLKAHRYHSHVTPLMCKVTHIHMKLHCGLHGSWVRLEVTANHS